MGSTLTHSIFMRIYSNQFILFLLVCRATLLCSRHLWTTSGRERCLWTTHGTNHHRLGGIVADGPSPVSAG
jgi:hypothetical protein